MKRYKTAITFGAVALAVICVTLAPPAAAQSVTVNFAADDGPFVRRAQGYLYSWWHTRESPLHGNLELKPNAWRIGYWGTWDYEYQPMVDQGVNHIQVILTDAFRNRAHTTVGGFSHDYTWQGWSYTQVVAGTVQFVNERGWTNVAFDLINEPDAFGIDGIGDWYAEAWVPAFRIIRQLRPQAQIVGPGFFSANLSHLTNFLAKAKRDNVVPDIVSQHLLDNQRRDVVEYYTTEIRSLLTQYGLAERPISFNEYINPGHIGFVEDVVDAICQAERVKIHSAMHSSWDDSGELPPWNSTGDAACFDGVMSIPAQRERACYWTYKFYGDMAGRKPAISYAGTFDGVASVDTNEPVARVLIGGGGSSGNMTLNLNGVPAVFGSSLSVRVERVTSNGNDLTPAPTLHQAGSVAVSGGNASVAINGIPARAATMVTLRPAGLPARVDMPTFSPLRGNYWQPTDVTLACGTVGASIRYTTDGSAPTTNSTPYTGAIRVPVTTTIRALATKAGLANSEIANGTFTIRRFANGLYGEYFANTNLSGTASLTRGDAKIDQNYGGNRWDASLPSDNFSARWTGRIRPTVTGTYEFAAASDDGVRLWVGGTLLIDNWTAHAVTTNTGAIALNGGQDYDLRMEYYDGGGDAVAVLMWTPPGGMRATIPTARLFPPTAPSGTNLLVAGGTTWKYLAPASAGGAPTTNWTALAFDDAAWNAGPARIGYGGDGAVTVIDTSGGKPFTAYFRKTFTVANPAALSSYLDLSVIRDDGAVVYLNGTELFRDNMPTGAVGYATTALGGVGNDNETVPVQRQVPSSRLVAGTNILAIEIHQNDSGSDDLGFDCALTNPTNNTPPRIGGIAHRTAVHGVACPPVGFGVYDGELPPSLLTVSAASSSPGLIPTNTFVFGGFGPSRTLSFTPTAGQTGAVTLTVNASDGFATASTTFVVTVTAPPANTAPTISDVGNRSIQNTKKSDEILFTVGDGQTEPGRLTVTASSSNPTLIPNTNLYINGTAGWRTLAILPATNQTGAAVITLTASDGSLSATDTFTVTVLAGPVLTTYDFDDGTFQGWTDLTPANTNAGPRNWAISPPAFPGATHSGSGAIGQNIQGGTQDSSHPTLRLRSPVFNLNGSGDLTAQLRGGTGSGGSLAGTAVSALPANTASPGFQGIALRNVNTAAYVLSGGKASSGDDWQPVTFTQSQLAALDQGANYTLDLIDAGHGGWGWVAMDTVSIPGTLNLASNTPPTIGDVTNRTIAEDANTGAIPFTIGDAETPAGSLILTGSSSDTSLAPNGNMVFGGSGSNRTVTVAPAANRNGSCTITLTVSDGVLTANDTFVLTVTAVNDPPTISDIADRSILPGTNTGAIAFIVSDDETPAASLTVTKASSNTNLVPLANVVLSGTGSNRTVTVTPAGTQTGTVTVTLTVSDGALTAGDSFVLTVTSNLVYAPYAQDHFLAGGNAGAGQYAAGNLNGQNPTLSGFSGAWLKAGYANGDLQFYDLGLNYTNLQTAGGRSMGQDASRSGRVLSSPFNNSSVGTYYLSFLLKLDSDHPDRYRGFELHHGGFDDGANRVLQLGQSGGDLGVNGFGLRINNNNALRADLGAANLSVNLFVLKFIFSSSAGADAITVWRNPTSLGGGEPGGGITLSGFDLQFDRTSLGSWLTPVWETYVPISLDELRLGTSWASVTPPGTSSDNRIVFDFDDGTYQGWTQIMTNNNYSPQYFEVAGGGDAHSGSYAMKQHLADTWPGFADLEHDTLWIRSPPFRLNSSGDLTFWLMGGASNTVGAPPANDAAVPLHSVDTVNGGFHGVFLRNASNGTFVLVGNRTTNGAPEGPLWEQVRFTAAQLAALDQGATYTLDLIDARNNSWAWCNLDTVVIPGALIPDTNTAPTISDVADVAVPLGTDPDPIAFVVGDAQTPADELLVTAISSNTNLVPEGGIILGGTGSNRTVTLLPNPGEEGAATITLTVSDGSRTASDTFVLTVGNTPPTISDIASQTVNISSNTGPIAFTVGDAQTPAGDLLVTAVSSNLALVLPEGLVLGGSGSNRTLTVTPIPGESGAATITLTVSDGSQTASDSFVLTVGNPPAPYTFTFDDGTLQGWTVVSTDAQLRQFFALQPLGVHSPNTTPQAGTHFVGLHIPAFSLNVPGVPNYTQDSTHNALWLRSPAFKLNGTGNLTAWLSGGNGYGADATGKLVADVPTNSFDNPSATPFPSFLGVALRNADTGVFVLAGRKANNGNDWEPVTFTSAQLAALDTNATYTLDLIDVREGGWGWCNMDTVTIPGAFLNTAPALAAVSNAALLAGRTLMVTNNATDPESPPQTLTYSLLAAPSGATIDAASGVVTWRPAIAQSLTTNLFTVRVADSGIPSLSAARSFTVAVLGPAESAVSSVNVLPNQFIMRVTGDTGPDYVVEWATNLLEDVAWRPLYTNQSPPMPLILTNDMPDSPRWRLYRTRLAP